MNTTASKYAKSLYKSFVDANMQYRDALKDFDLIISTIKKSDKLYNVLTSPVIKQSDKLSIIDDVFENSISKLLINLLKILIDNNEFLILNDVNKEYRLLCDETDGIKRASVISAIDINNDLRDSITNKLSAMTSKKIVADWSVDPDIIGGIIVNIDDTVIDMSIKNKLNKIMKGNI